MKLLDRLTRRRVEGGVARAHLVRVERVLNERHERDKEERKRLYDDLTMLRQQLAIARRIKHEGQGHGD